MIRHRSRFFLVAGMVAVVVAGCSAAGLPHETVAPPSAQGTSGPRPASPAVVTIVEPATGAEITGSSVHVVLTLTGATIVSATTTNLKPDEGHVHLYVNNALVSMNYGLEQDLPIQPGTYVVKAEFVAADHAPFNPRVWSPEIYFTVK